MQRVARSVTPSICSDSARTLHFVSTTKYRADRIMALRLAAEADIDPRSAAKALTEGPEALRGRVREKAAAALDRLGLGASPSSEPTRAA